MISVGIRDLKNQLSQYLQYVKRGEKILITEHNRVIAEISLPREENLSTNVETELENLFRLGKLQKAQRNNSLQTNTETSDSVDWISVYRNNREG